MPLYDFAKLVFFLNKETISNEINCDKACQEESKQNIIKTKNPTSTEAKFLKVEAAAVEHI